MRNCLHCSVTLEGKRSNAIYCSRSCKTLAASKRRIERDPDYDRRRYAEVEAPKRRGQARQYYADHAEERRIYSRNYRATNKSIRRQQAARRRGLVAASDPIPITPKEWRRLKARFRDCCAYCGAKSLELQMDHVIPLAKGGRHAPANILPACPPCNISKRDHFLSVWRHSRREEVPPPHGSEDHVRRQ